MDQIWLQALTLSAAGAVVYHHALYPRLMKAMGRRSPAAGGTPDGFPALPAMSVIMPVYNEARHIDAKLRNLDAQIYPGARLQVLIGCDGSTDGTAALARRSAAACRRIDVTVVAYPRNRGKIAVLNDLAAMVTTPLMAFSDASAFIPETGLAQLALELARPDTGAAGAGYRPAPDSNPGERAYWRYQTAVKSGEGRVGGLLGAHGALYAIRRALFRPLPVHCINDDFVIPFRIAAGGWRTVYRPDIAVREREPSPLPVDFARRLRISRGNAQQLALLATPGLWRRPGLLFCFLSGKVARVAMPFAMIASFAGSGLLAAESGLFAAAFALQALLYTGAGIAGCLPPAQRPGVLEALRYLVAGHCAGAVGALRQLASPRGGAWSGALIPTSRQPS